MPPMEKLGKKTPPKSDLALRVDAVVRDVDNLAQRMDDLVPELEAAHAFNSSANMAMALIPLRAEVSFLAQAAQDEMPYRSDRS